MDAVYPAASALARGRRRRRGDQRHRTMPITFAEIKEVDEEKEESEEAQAASAHSVASDASVEQRCRLNVLDQRLEREFTEFRRRRARHDQHEPDEDHATRPPCPLPLPASRASSEPRPDAGPS